MSSVQSHTCSSFKRIICCSPSTCLEDEVGVGRTFWVLVARPTLPVGVGWSWTLGERLHHLCFWKDKNKKLCSIFSRAVFIVLLCGVSLTRTLVVLLLLSLVDVQRQLLHPHALLLLGLLLVEVVRRQVGGQWHVQDLILETDTRRRQP